VSTFDLAILIWDLDSDLGFFFSFASVFRRRLFFLIGTLTIPQARRMELDWIKCHSSHHPISLSPILVSLITSFSRSRSSSWNCRCLFSFIVRSRLYVHAICIESGRRNYLRSSLSYPLLSISSRLTTFGSSTIPWRASRCLFRPLYHGSRTFSMRSLSCLVFQGRTFFVFQICKLTTSFLKLITIKFLP